MFKVAINTPQNISIDFPIADLPLRFLARLIDFVVIFCMAWLLDNLIEFLFPSMRNMDYWSQIAVQVLIYSPILTYSLWMETLLRGKTLGKLVLNIQAIRTDGKTYSWEDALVRWILLILDFFPFFGLTGFLAILMTEKSQRIGDLAASTIVISNKKNVNFSSTILMELAEDYQPVFNQVRQLSDSDVNIIKRRFDIALKNNDVKLLAKIRSTIEKEIKIQDSSLKDKAFIQTVLKDFNYFTRQ